MSIQEEVQNMPPIEVILKIILPKMNNRIKTLNADVQALQEEVEALKAAAPKKRAPRKKKADEAPAPVPQPADPAPVPQPADPAPVPQPAAPAPAEQSVGTMLYTYDSEQDEFVPLTVEGWPLTGNNIGLALYAMHMMNDNIGDAASMSLLSEGFIKFVTEMTPEQRTQVNAKFPVQNPTYQEYFV